MRQKSQSALRKCRILYCILYIFFQNFKINYQFSLNSSQLKKTKKFIASSIIETKISKCTQKNVEFFTVHYAYFLGFFISTTFSFYYFFNLKEKEKFITWPIKSQSALRKCRSLYYILYIIIFFKNYQFYFNFFNLRRQKYS